MKPIINTLIGLFLLLTSTAALQGQSMLELALSQTTISGPVGSTVDVTVTATKFQGIVTMEFPMKFDPAILEVVAPLYPANGNPAVGVVVPTPSPLSGFISGTNIIVDNNLGRILISWFENAGNPTNLANNSLLFTIRFRIKATGTSNFFIAPLTNPNATIEVVGAGGAPAMFTYPTFVIPPCSSATSFAIAPTPEPVGPGQLICIPFNVNDFLNVVSMQFGINWNNSVLTFSHVQNFNIPDLDCTNFNFTPGRLVFKWDDVSGAGITMPDCATIFDVCFTAAATPGNTTITINGNGLPQGSPASAENAGGTVLWNANSGVPTPIAVTAGTQPSIQTVHFDVGEDTIDGANVILPIRVRNFDNISSFSFVVTFDPSVVTYDGLGGPALSQLNPNPIGQPQALTVTVVSPGVLQITYNSLNTLGVTLADLQSVLNLRFSPANGAPPNSLSAVTIGSLTTPPVPFRVVEGSNSSTATCRFWTPQKADGFVRTSANAAPQIALVTKTDVSCFGTNNGSIDISITSVAGGNAPTINWSSTPAPTDPEDITGLAPGTYTVTVTGALGLTSTMSVTIAGPAAALGVSSNQLTNVPCFGGTNGAINITTAGGTAPYTWNWSHTPASTDPEDPTNLNGGSYTVTITDSKNCVHTATYNVSAPSTAIALSTSNVQNVRCLGDNNGSVNLSVANANNSGLGVGYIWRSTTSGSNTISTAQNPTNLPAGTYNVTITDGVGCTASLAQPVTIQPAPSALVVAQPTKTDPACANVNNGSICISAPTGGWGNYTIAWANNALSGFCPTNAGVGTFTATITDGGGCTAVRSTTLTAAPAVTVANSNVSHVTCHNQGNGSITITTTGAFNSINWTGPNGPAGGGTTISNLEGGNYIPTITYAGGCTTVGTAINVNNPTPIDVTVNTTQQTPTGPGSIDINVSGGVGTYTYTWSTGATTQDLTAAPAGTYTVTITDQRGCANSRTILVTNACIICGAISTPESACEEDGCIEITIPAGTQGPITVNYTGPKTGVAAFNNQSNYSLCGLPAGPYSVVLTDGAGQTFTLPVVGTTVGQNPPVQLGSVETDPSEANSNGSIILTPGSGLPLSYDWSDNVPGPLQNSAVLFGLDSGYYCVTVTNELPGGCTKTYCFTLERLYPPITCSTVATNPTCAQSTNGGINLTVNGGDNVYSYTWSNGATTQDLANLGQGTYSVTVTDGRGITQVCSPVGGDILTAASQTVISNVNETSNYNGFQVSGAAECNGVANAVVSGNVGNVTYQWSNGVTTANNTTLCGGAYTVSVTDAAGCTVTWSNELTAPTAITATSTLLTDFNGFGVSCFERCDGTARVVASGGVAPYVVRWPSGRTEQVNSSGGSSIEDDLCGGTMTVTITDANNVTTSYDFTIAEPEEIQFQFTDVAPSTLANCDAEIIVSTTGTVGTVAIEWVSQFSRGQGERADELCSEEAVTFTVTDANGCTASDVYTVPFPVEECFKPVPVLTPNEDGDNDYFELKCIDEYPNTVELFDRWNRAVTPKITNYQNNWDGTRNGVPLPEGVYFYVATFQNSAGQSIQVKGFINLLR
jgi:gliding motility-associated-like protein